MAFADKLARIAQNDPTAREAIAARNAIPGDSLAGFYANPGQALSPEMLQYLYTQGSGGRLDGDGLLQMNQPGTNATFTYYGPHGQSYDYGQNGDLMRQYSSHDSSPSEFAKFMAVVASLGYGAAAAGGASAAGGAGAASSAPVLGSTGALTGTELGAAGASGVGAAGAAGAGGAGGAAGAGALDLGGGLTMAADGSIVGATGAAPATASQMAGMGLGGGGGGLFSGLGSALGSSGGSSMPSWLGPAASVAGALLGSQGQKNSATTSTALDPRLDSAVFGGLVPTTAGLLANQTPLGLQTQQQLMQVGSGLLGQSAPNTPTNPYVAGILDDLQRRNQQMLDTSFNGIRDNAVGVGGLGDSRQGVAQGLATARAADNFTGQAANLMGSLYNSDQNRLLQQQTLGAGLLAQGQQAPWAPVNNAAGVYGQFRPQTTTVTSNQGGGAMGALGGALGAAQFGKSMGWWG